MAEYIQTLIGIVTCKLYTNVKFCLTEEVNMAKEFWVPDSGLDEEANQTAMFDSHVSITSRMSHLSDYIFASLLVFICK